MGSLFSLGFTNSLAIKKFNPNNAGIVVKIADHWWVTPPPLISCLAGNRICKLMEVRSPACTAD
jgi:hypothetical protein